MSDSGGMEFDVNVTYENACTRVAVRGECGIGRLLSLLQVLGLDSSNWSRDTLLLDLRELQARLDEDEQYRLAGEASGVLPRLRKIALLTRGRQMCEASDVHAFADEGQALRWLSIR
jgi:hypothetical protein